MSSFVSESISLKKKIGSDTYYPISGFYSECVKYSLNLSFGTAAKKNTKYYYYLMETNYSKIVNWNQDHILFKVARISFN